MAQLKKSLAILKRFELPSTAELPQEQRAWVEMDNSELLAGDYLDGLNAGDDNADRQGELLVNRIKAWNFTDEAGVTEKINLNSVRHMEVKDLVFLFNQLDVSPGTSLTADQKKTSLSI